MVAPPPSRPRRARNPLQPTTRGCRRQSVTLLGVRRGGTAAIRRNGWYHDWYLRRTEDFTRKDPGGEARSERLRAGALSCDALLRAVDSVAGCCGGFAGVSGGK